MKTLTVLAVLGLSAMAGLAQTVPQEKPAVSAEARGLRQEIEKLYQVLPIKGGVKLTPRQAHSGVRSVEMSGNEIAVNGEPVSTQTFRDWLQADADPVLRLLELSAGQRRALFDLAVEAPVPSSPDTNSAATSTPADDEEDRSGLEEPETPESPEAPGRREPSVHSDSRVNFGGSITVEKDEVAEEAVAIGGSVRVEGEVRQNAVAIGGPVRINGTVGGDVTSVGSTVHLGPNAVVEGDVTSVGGTVDRARGARVHGDIAEVGMLRDGSWTHGWRSHWEPDFGPFFLFGASMRVFGSLVWMIFLVLFACLSLLLAPRALERVERAIALEPWKAAAVGLVGSFSLLPLLIVLAVLLVITIVGCIFLLLYPVLAVVLVFVFLFGYAAVALRTGRWFEERFGRRLGSPYAAVLIGVLLLQIWSVIGQVLSFGPGVLHLFAFMFRLFAFLVSFSASMMGFGGVLLAIFGSGTTWTGRHIVPPVPPQPAPPASPISPGPVAESLPLSEGSWEEPPVEPDL